MDSVCKGCKCYYYNSKLKTYYCYQGLKPSVLYHSEMKLCPCINCLVKGVCVDICQEFRNYRRRYYIRKGIIKGGIMKGPK